MSAGHSPHLSAVPVGVHRRALLTYACSAALSIGVEQACRPAGTWHVLKLSACTGSAAGRHTTRLGAVADLLAWPGPCLAPAGTERRQPQWHPAPLRL